jgi:DNA-binding NarL/FixJ family response regulator
VITSSDRNPSSVLIVDDDAELRWVLRLLFEFEDFEIAGEASNGVEGIALALKHEPDFIVLDYAMSGMNGDKTAQILRKLVPDTRIVAFSAVLHEKPMWADAFLNKDRISQIAPLLVSLVEDSETV